MSDDPVRPLSGAHGVKLPFVQEPAQYRCGRRGLSRFGMRIRKVAFHIANLHGASGHRLLWLVFVRSRWAILSQLRVSNKGLPLAG